MRKVVVVVLAAMLVSGMLFAAGARETAEQETYTIKLGHSNQPTMDSIFHQVSLKLQELVQEYSDGRITVEIYPASQLGSEEQQVQSTQLGTQEIVVVGMNNLNPSIPQLGYFTLPYIFESTEEGRRVIDNMWEQNNEWAINSAGLRLLAVMDAGFREITNSKQPVTRLEHLRNIRVRVPQNPIQIATYRAWGVNPIVIAWSETFNALQQGVVDAQDNPYTVFVSEKFYEIQKYVTEVSYIFQTSAIVISESYFQSLPADLQEVVVRAGKETMEFERQLSDNSLEKDKQTLRERGMTLLGPPEDKDEWVRRARTIWPDFYAMIGNGDAQRGKEILEIVESYK